MAPVTPSSGQGTCNRKAPLRRLLHDQDLHRLQAGKPANRTNSMPALQCDALTLQADLQKRQVLLELRGHLQSIPADKVIILGDFNTRVGQDVDAWKGVLGRHGVGNCNDNGRLLLELCTKQQLGHHQHIFQQKDRLKTTWMHPWSKHWHLIDYVLVRQKDLKDVLRTRVMPSAECHTDHRLVRSKLRLHFKPKPRKRGPPTKKFDLEKLQSSEVKADFQADLQSKLESVDCPEDPSPETLWDQLKTAILQTYEEVLGFTTKRNKDWFDENNQEIQELLTKKRSAHQAHLAQPSCPVRKAAFHLICSNLQHKLREIQNEWWTNLAEKTHLCADTGDYRGFYEALKAVYGPTHHVQSPLRSADGQALFTDKTSILSCWSEHFQALFSADRVVQGSAVLRIRQKPVIEELDESVARQQECGKTAGVDGIPPEIWKNGRDQHYTASSTNSLSVVGSRASFQETSLVPTIAEDHLPETQCGFRTNRGTTDMVFVLRHLQEKCREQNKPKHLTL
ncbi:uncharacterized protein LOC119571119 [Penaeus monodon]|uniref:uncharacterized protein LOC119571119 n=1 Tax=Penaeus monodon TaxID=6687 RepID=UPI0018A7DE0E|nr:uncharacterized protein LOC119571119 [Penaeus monodon]